MTLWMALGLKHAEDDRGDKTQGEHGRKCPTRCVSHVPTPAICALTEIVVMPCWRSLGVSPFETQENLVTHCNKNEWFYNDSAIVGS